MLARILRLVAVVVLGLGTLLGCEASLVAPDPSHRLSGTYTFTAAMSASCPKRFGPSTMRADIEIEPDGRNYTVTLHEGDFKVFGFLADSTYDSFRCQDNPDGVLFFSRGGGYYGERLFSETRTGVWSSGTARGQFGEGRIAAVFNGYVDTSAVFNGVNDRCRATDHAWTLVRR